MISPEQLTTDTCIIYENHYNEMHANLEAWFHWDPCFSISRTSHEL